VNYSQCVRKDSCLEFRRQPTIDELHNRWADRDVCMNCKRGKEFEKEDARNGNRPPSPDLSCIYCGDRLSITTQAIKRRKLPLCHECGNRIPTGLSHEEKTKIIDEMRGLQ
jgi:hypothetical protein